jgi:ElaB/YqjD/DUF883 family membrane-anchored ribosome-binding protein
MARYGLNPLIKGGMLIAQVSSQHSPNPPGDSHMAPQTSTATDASSGLRDTVDRATQTAHDAIDRMASKAGPALEQLQSAASTAAQSLQDKAASFGELEEAWLESARKSVREHPLAAVAVAIAAGMLISRITSR